MEFFFFFFTYMKQFETSKETHASYLQTFDMFSIIYFANLKQYSHSSHVRHNCDSSVLALVSKILYRALEENMVTQDVVPGLPRIT
jgi:hypothetical protein